MLDLCYLHHDDIVRNPEEDLKSVESVWSLPYRRIFIASLPANQHQPSEALQLWQREPAVFEAPPSASKSRGSVDARLCYGPSVLAVVMLHGRGKS